jgi:hypothetical protein
MKHELSEITFNIRVTVKTNFPTHDNLKPIFGASLEKVSKHINVSIEELIDFLQDKVYYNLSADSNLTQYALGLILRQYTSGEISRTFMIDFFNFYGREFEDIRISQNKQEDFNNRIIDALKPFSEYPVYDEIKNLLNDLEQRGLIKEYKLNESESLELKYSPTRILDFPGYNKIIGGIPKVYSLLFNKKLYKLEIRAQKHLMKGGGIDEEEMKSQNEILLNYKSEIQHIDKEFPDFRLFFINNLIREIDELCDKLDDSISSKRLLNYLNEADSIVYSTLKKEPNKVFEVFEKSKSKILGEIFKNWEYGEAYDWLGEENNRLMESSYFDAMTDGQLGDFDDFSGNDEDIENWSGG